jgi:hypothetical protein
MKRTIVYSIILLLLGIAVYYFTTTNKTGSYSEADRAFSVADTNTIGKIFIADMRGEKITLTRVNNQWTVNGKTPVRPESINTLLQTISQLRADMPVAKSMMKNVIKSMATENIKVELYNLQGEKLKAYYIGNPNMNYDGNFALMDGSDVAFVIHIPGYDGIISTRFTTNFLEWKSRNVFDFPPATIQEVSVQYTHNPDSSFSIQKDAEGIFQLQGRTGFNPELTKYFVSQFENINCESYVTDTYKLDSLKGQEPVCTITVKNASGLAKAIKIYYRPVTYRTKLQFTYDGKEINFDLDKFYGLMNDEQDLAIIQNFVFGKLFVGPRFFYQQRPTDRNVLVDAVLQNLQTDK